MVQALPITATQCAVAALISAVWALVDGVGLGSFSLDAGLGSLHGWLLDETTRSRYALPGLFFDESVRTVCYAALWTGLVTTAANRIAETVALGRLASSEASVLLATEPLWAALFAALCIGESLGSNDVAGGALLVGACVANALQPESLRAALGLALERKQTTDAGGGPAGGELPPPAETTCEEA